MSTVAIVSVVWFTGASWQRKPDFRTLHAMLLTGHKTRSVFDRYDIVSEADLREAVSRLAAAPTPKPTASSGRVLRAKQR